jgi:hypothetical protein
MTEEQRLAAFSEALAGLKELYGVDEVISTRVEQHGQKIELLPAIVHVLIPGWQSPHEVMAAPNGVVKADDRITQDGG